jgi:Exopolysaccharide biosynthesis protein
MKKVGIVTFQYDNYGTRLQNYALVVILEKLGYEVNTLYFCSSKELVKKCIKKVILFTNPNNSKKHLWENDLKKEEKFSEFVKNNLRIKKVTNKNLKKLNEQYDYFIAGSDQIWNPIHLENHPVDKKLFFLKFASKEKRIAFAPSFGVKEIPEDRIDDYKNLLSGFEEISVREKAGQEIIENLINIKVPILPDPTLSLPMEYWENLTKENNKKHEKEKYIIAYFLSKQSLNVISEIEKYANDNNLKVISIVGNYYDDSMENPDPIEFISLIRNAKAVFTDSFHGCVFSIVNETPIVVYKRTDVKQFSRIENLLNNFNLTEACYSEKYNISRILKTQKSSITKEVITNYNKQAIEYFEKGLK